MIAFIMHALKYCGGTEKQLLELIKYTEKQGQDFIIITKELIIDKNFPEYRNYANKIIVYNFNDYPKFLNHRVIWRLIPYYRKWKFRHLIRNCDIINLHDNDYEEIYPFLQGKNVYWQLNDLQAAFHVGVHSEWKDNSWAKNMREHVLKYTSSFKEISVNVSKNAERVKQCLGRDAHVFYCGVDPICINRDNRNTFERFRKKEINILTSGGFFEFRNYESQIEVVKLLISKGYDVKLRIIGPLIVKSYSDTIKGLIENEGLSNRIIIEGQVDDDRFKYLHQNADIFMFIDIDQSWGLAVFEAMSCGLPVLVSNSVGATEILNDDVDSIFVNPTDIVSITKTIERLMVDEDYYTRISEKASIYHKDWTWEKAYCSKMYNLMTSK